jgi:hypothetical protein
MRRCDDGLTTTRPACFVAPEIGSWPRVGRVGLVDREFQNPN